MAQRILQSAGRVSLSRYLSLKKCPSSKNGHNFSVVRIFLWYSIFIVSQRRVVPWEVLLLVTMTAPGPFQSTTSDHHSRTSSAADDSMMTIRTTAHGQQEVFGGKNNFWLYSKTHGYDLTHPRTPTSPLVFPRVPLETTKGPVAIDPTKTALVVIDLQNYFLSPHIGRPSDAVGLKVVDKLLQHAIPACRKAGMPVVWMNWGLTEQDIEEMPPTIVQGFATDNNFDGQRRIEGLGSDVGSVKLEDGTIIEGGRVLMPDQWNTALYTPLEEKRQPQDILIHKNRLSGFWGGTASEGILKSRGIRSLIFSDANVDQCVGGTLQDAVSRGWDYFLLSDGCATTSPAFAQQCIEFNAELGWGFLLSCEDLERSVENLQTSPGTGT